MRSREQMAKSRVKERNARMGGEKKGLCAGTPCRAGVRGGMRE
jgi:hypothetical protein